MPMTRYYIYLPSYHGDVDPDDVLVIRLSAEMESSSDNWNEINLGNCYVCMTDNI
jgi:hypothetical protein